MPMHYRIDPIRDFLVGNASGLLTAEEIIDEFSRIIRETKGAAFYKPHLFLIDDRAQLSDIDVEAIGRVKEAAETWGQTYAGRSVRAAFVAPQAQQAAVVMLWQVVTVQYPAIGVHARIFQSEQVAERWLRGEIA